MPARSRGEQVYLLRIERISMNHLFKHLFVISFLLIISCSSSVQKTIEKQPKLENVYFIPTEILSVDKNKLTIKVEKPVLFEGNPKLSFSLARGIIENSYLVAGMEYDLGKNRVEIEKIRGDEVIVKLLSNNYPMKVNDKAKMFLDRKIIAIKDFEVIKGRNIDIAKYIQEDITTALVNSGQFIVVERLKLNSILDELKLQLSGLVDSKTVREIGKLVGADFILTGTFASIGEEWNVNLRLINAETGLITSAINKTGALHELKTEAFKETKNIDATFENGDSDFPGWILGEKFNGRTGNGGHQNIYVDDSSGANNSRRSLAGAFKTGTERAQGYRNQQIQVRIRNRLSRDLSNYSGVNFFIKSNKAITIRFSITDSEKKSQEEENWVKNIIVSTEWRQIQFPFNSLSLHRGKAKRNGTNQILELANIEKIEWIVDERNAVLGTEGTIWIDDVFFY